MILLVGPLLPPITGQSLAFTRVYESFDSREIDLINTNLEKQSNMKKSLNTLFIIFKIFLKIFFKQYDTIYFTCSRSLSGSLKDIVLIQLASFKKIKIINHLHGSDFYDFLHSSPIFYKKILINSYNKVNTSIVLLDSMKNQFKDFPNMNIEVIPNFYDDNLNVDINEKNLEEINILYLSNIIKSKGIFELIEAFKNINKTYNIKLNIAGTFVSDENMNQNEVKNRFYELIENEKNINYLGLVYGNNKIELLKKSDIFVLPSYYKSEAFPISIIEAMRCGNAIITTNYKYLPDVISEKNGFLVTTKSIDELAKAIERLILNKELLKQLQKTNIDEAKEKYSLEQYISNIKRVIK